MPVYNETFDEINRSIKSILNQTFTNFEFIIIDDNPKSYFLRKELLKWKVKDSRIKLIFNKENLGVVESENKGIKYSKGEYVIRADADDVSCRNRFKSQLNFLINNNLDLTGCNCELVSASHHIISHHFFSNVTQCNQEKIKHVMSYCNIMSGSNLLFKRHLFDNIHGYRVKLIDDYDFASRALVQGFRIGYQSSSLVLKTARSSSISNSNALKQFVGTVTLGKYLRKSNFLRNISLTKLNMSFNSVSNSELERYKAFEVLKSDFKLNNSIISLIESLFIMFSSRIIFCKVIWNKLVFNRQSKFIE